MFNARLTIHIQSLKNLGYFHYWLMVSQGTCYYLVYLIYILKIWEANCIYWGYLLLPGKPFRSCKLRKNPIFYDYYSNKSILGYAICQSSVLFFRTFISKMMLTGFELKTKCYVFLNHSIIPLVVMCIIPIT
jgi:hypothetical protein